MTKRSRRGYPEGPKGTPVLSDAVDPTNTLVSDPDWCGGIKVRVGFVQSRTLTAEFPETRGVLGGTNIAEYMKKHGLDFIDGTHLGESGPLAPTFKIEKMKDDQLSIENQAQLIEDSEGEDEPAAAPVAPVTPPPRRRIPEMTSPACSERDPLELPAGCIKVRNKDNKQMMFLDTTTFTVTSVTPTPDPLGPSFALTETGVVFGFGPIGPVNVTG